MTTNKILTLFNDFKNDWMERIFSTTDTDKFGQAICVSPNGMPDRKREDWGTVFRIAIQYVFED